ncbi:hypothetical protein F4861DRAFT_501089 [Xylaria intraflava]|nr:hypothetical protein F4861DRAFT_501089 [Xylaria intraflava]
MHAAILTMLLGAGFAASVPRPTKTCSEPPNQTTGNPNYDTFCKCESYANETAWGNPYLGLESCDTKCAPADAAQTAAHNDQAGSMTTCMNACSGSFEKSKRRGDGYWFCHGVNFVEGELCEFIGALGAKTLVPGSGNHCWILNV